jgi:hypothetical protein
LRETRKHTRTADSTQNSNQKMLIKTIKTREREKEKKTTTTKNQRNKRENWLYTGSHPPVARGLDATEWNEMQYIHTYILAWAARLFCFFHLNNILLVGTNRFYFKKTFSI